MKTDNSKKLKMQTQLSVLTAAIGGVFMIYMIFVESEPGAIPLLLIIAGGGWYFFNQYRIRSQ